MTRLALVVDGVGRDYTDKKKAVTALSEVSFSVGRGEIVGLLGVNGAGKTTLLRIIATLLTATRGRVLVDGVDVAADPKEARTRLSVVFGGDRGHYPRLSALDNAMLFGSLSGMPTRSLANAARDALASVGLLDVADRSVNTFSKGMKQRLHLAVGLMARPALVMLDEPTVGLDPLETERLRAAVAKLPGEGIGVLLTSHNLQDIERLASRVVILQEGRVSHDLPLDDLVEQSGGGTTVTVLSSEPCHAATEATEASGIRVLVSEPSADESSWRTEFEVAEWTRDSLRVLAQLWPSGVIRDVRVQPVGLEQVFKHLAGAESGASG
ncbi:ABC transporter ATP-binding protein [Streptomyces phyllanthi]|uniref:ABC transporter ATP-binding protein n=1 Tax=Streptomyces phyllanthi TaxID=1803180 RepID=A0A5N8VX00_9ACTN|nr:ABC transporter ATP-binding protein [Streptomyces phyllanthi]MPY38594.1 ABC transporter ATP-binding protein [Streptomyces phyllanthi]